MPLFRVNKAGAVGFIDQRDLRPHELPPEGWSSVSNARMLNGSAISVSPWTQIADLGAGTAHALDFLNSDSGPSHLYVYLDDKIQSVDNNGFVTDVSKVGLVSEAWPKQVWITDQLNGIPISTNNRDAPQCFYNPSGPVTNLTLSQDFPNWQSAVTAKIVVAYKNFIVALNIVDTDAFPNMVWWSDAAEDGKMPASWDYTDPQNLSGRTTLGAEAGAILGAAVLRDSLFIYTEYSTYRMDFIGGQFIMRFTRVFQNSGIFGPRCVAKYGESHFVITKSDIIIHDGQQMTSVGDMKVRNRFFEGISDADFNKVWVSTYLRFSEVWVGVPNSSDDTFNVCVPWQSDESVWSVRALPDSRYMKELPILEASAFDDSWNGGINESWTDGPDNIWNAGGSVGDMQPVVTSTDNFLYVIDAGMQTDDTVIQREGINLTGDDTTEMLRTVYPRIRGQEAIQVRVGSRDVVEGVTQWDDYMSFTPQVDYKINVRSNGRRHAIEFKGKNFDLEGYDMEFVVRGRR